MSEEKVVNLRHDAAKAVITRVSELPHLTTRAFEAIKALTNRTSIADQDVIPAMRISVDVPHGTVDKHHSIDTKKKYL